jgi:hypothetical protein
MKAKKFHRKLRLGKSTIANLSNVYMNLVKGAACGTDPEGSCVSEFPGCDTRSLCNVTEGKPYLCPSLPANSTCYPGCPSMIC